MNQSHEITFINIDALKPHEEVKPKKAEHYARFASRAKRVFAKPILIDAATKVILDGHHRWYALKEAGCKKVPCCTVDYLNDDSITVLPRRDDIPVTKEDVIQMGLSGETYPPKTTKHVYNIPEMEKEVNLKNVSK